MFGIDADEQENNSEDDDRQGGDNEPKSFDLLSDLSDLLMLPKDMLMDRQVRQEVNLTILIHFCPKYDCYITA